MGETLMSYKTVKERTLVESNNVENMIYKINGIQVMFQNLQNYINVKMAQKK